MTRPCQHRAFTLIDLLVVITIIVVLLALLTPALDKAVYQAQLAACAGNLRSIAAGVIQYAVQNGRQYPDTPRGFGTFQPAWIGAGNATIPQDRRRVLRAALGGLNKPLNDPLTGAGVDFEGSTAANIFSNYNLWFAWFYAGRPAMKKLGDRLTYLEKSAFSSGTMERSSNILAADRDVVSRPTEAQSSHPDADGLLSLMRRQDETNPWVSDVLPAAAGQTITMGIWWSKVTAERGYTDDNFAADDGSVLRVDRIDWKEDERLARPPVFGGADPNYPKMFQYLPK